MASEKTVFVKDYNLDFTEFCIAMHKNGYFIPSTNSNLVTIEYLKKVRSKTIKCPLYSEIRLRPCPVFPEKKDLAAAVLTVAMQEGWNFGFQAEGPQPDCRWMVHVLSTYKPDH